VTITAVKLNQFTAFRRLELEASPGINIFIGANDTGKTHLLKVIYAACDITRTKGSLPEKLLRVFLPYQLNLGRLVYRQPGTTRGSIEVYRDALRIRVSFSNHATTATSATVTGAKEWETAAVECAYLPVKEMLAHAPGFRSLYTAREIHFEEIYADIVDRAYRPLLRGPMDATRQRLLHIIQRAMDGRVVTRDEEFFLHNRQGNLEFTLLAEGIRKLALLWLLIQNGTFLQGAVVCWDEPEANLNPRLIGTVVDILLELQRMGVQVFLATHDYVVLKEFDLRKKADDAVRFHALFRDAETGEIAMHSTDDYLSIYPNAIADTFMDLYDRDVARALSETGKE
jgi:AAA domain, putative AbiEii toxin, Type IV TA system